LAKLSHYSDRGEISMVDVSAKSVTTRTATAHAFVRMTPRVVRAIRSFRNPKGDPLEIARIAGIAAAKRTAELIPLCHPIALSHVALEAEVVPGGVRIVAKVSTTGPTGVEMEALTAASVAALTLYDMCKALDKGIVLHQIQLESKTGGKSGDYHREA